MPLDGSEKYSYMVEYALKAKSSPSAKIVIEATSKVTEKEKVRIQLSFAACDVLMPSSRSRIRKARKM
jgi:hypothetical protein